MYDSIYVSMIHWPGLADPISDKYLIDARPNIKKILSLNNFRKISKNNYLKKMYDFILINNINI